jgi:5-methylcytosine-specific restriction endonuclease McrBC regulatory subunit McrC
VERILNLLSPDFRAGDRSAPGLLFDMNLLFERTVERKMADWAEARGWALETQDESRFLAKIQGPPTRPAYRIRPDLVFRHHGRVVGIADAKWKRPELSRSGFVLPAQSDLYQIQSYAAVFACTQVALIYPLTENFRSARKTVLSLAATSGTPLRLPRIDGHALSPKEGLNDDKEETCRGNAPALRRSV